MQRTRFCFQRRRALTLVELMMVIMATLIVASIVWKTAGKAINWANDSRMSIEVSQMSQAMEAFCAQFGDYPPDFHDQILVWKFMKARFPQCPREKYPDFTDHSPASALYFWLGGPNGNGFSSNPANPFDDNTRRIGPFFKFDRERVKTVDGVRQFFPPRSKDGTPYIYFRGSKLGYTGHPGWEQAKPYVDSNTLKWIDPAKYQILCPGNDGKFGAGNHYPGGSDYDAANLDDIASFSKGETLGKQKPALIKDKKPKEE
jgi:hypothetical protein